MKIPWRKTGQMWCHSMMIPLFFCQALVVMMLIGFWTLVYDVDFMLNHWVGGLNPACMWFLTWQTVAKFGWSSSIAVTDSFHVGLCGCVGCSWTKQDMLMLVYIDMLILHYSVHRYADTTLQDMLILVCTINGIMKIISIFESLSVEKKTDQSVTSHYNYGDAIIPLFCAKPCNDDVIAI